MAQEFWQEYVRSAIASKDFGDALEICLRALADEAGPAFAALKGLADRIPTRPGQGTGADLVAPLEAACAALARVEEVLALTAQVIAATGGPAAPPIGPIDRAELEAAAAKTRAAPGGTRLARHSGALRRAAYGAAGHLERMLDGPEGEGLQALDGLTSLVHETQAGLRISHKLLAAAACLFREPDPAGD